MRFGFLKPISPLPRSEPENPKLKRQKDANTYDLPPPHHILDSQLHASIIPPLVNMGLGIVMPSFFVSFFTRSINSGIDRSGILGSSLMNLGKGLVNPYKSKDYQFSGFDFKIEVPLAALWLKFSFPW